MPEAQYRALMDTGLTYAHAWNLVPGAEETLTHTALTHTGSSLLSKTGNVTVAANQNPSADPYQGVVQVDGSTIRAETGTVAISGKHIIL